VRAPVALDEFKRRVGEWCDDVGVISIDDPALAHERDEISTSIPHPLARLHDRRGEQGRDAVALPPSANNELYRCEERLWEMGGGPSSTSTPSAARG